MPRPESDAGSHVLPERYSAPTPIAPTAEAWAAMTPEEREDATWALIDALPIEETMSEGTEHSEVRISAFERLRRHFDAGARGLFIATELMVGYPGEPTFVPDLLAVREVEIRHRTAWMVAAEGRGIDLALEVRNKGKRAKDYKRNVTLLARLGVPEYFIYEISRREVAGFRLAHPEARTYTPILAQGGRYRSEVLDLDLMVLEGRLRFFRRGAELPGAAEEVELLGRLVADRTAQAEAEAERARAETERARAETERASRAIEAVREAVTLLLSARGRTLTPAEAAQLAAIEDPAALRDLVARAAAIGPTEALFEA